MIVTPLRLPTLQFGLADSVSIGNIGLALWLNKVSIADYTRVGIFSWISDTDLGALDPAFLSATPHETEAVVTTSAAVARVTKQGVNVTAAVAGAEDAAVQTLLAGIRHALPETRPANDEHRVPVAFWSLGSHGPVSRTRTIDVAPWEALHTNYAADVVRGLDALMSAEFDPAAGGQLIVWHGDPGTGKTWALRALGFAWRSWCDLHYITDPETFFGDRAAYMLDVLLEDLAVGHAEADDVDDRARDGRWKLLVLEDTGELLSADARQRSGQGLSRLLNVVDGLIGQGLRILVLLTTNEDLRDLHPAVSRPGRCAAHIEFTTLDRDEARQWLAERDLDAYADAQERWALAELYALTPAAKARVEVRRDRPVGFGGASS